jgi:hypothetical protein
MSHQANHTSVTRRGALGAIAATTAVTVAGARPAALAIDPIYAAIDAHRKVNAVALAEWAESTRLYELVDEKYVGQDREDAREALRGHEETISNGSNAVAYDAQAEFAATVPTTLPGLLAMIVYASELDDEDPEVFSDCRETLATAAQALMRGQS